MDILNDQKYLVDLLFRDRLITAEQKEVLDEKFQPQQRAIFEKRKKRRARTGKGKAVAPDGVEVIASFNLEIPGENPTVLSDELIMRAVADDIGMPFKKLDQLELDLEVVTKTIPKNYALKHLLLPFAVKNGVHEIAFYDPAKREMLPEIERVYKITIKPFLSTKNDISRMLAEFFGFQTSITAAEDHLASPMVDLGNLEQFVKIERGGEVSSSDHHITSAVDHLFTYAFDQRASDIHIEPKRGKSNVRLRIDGVLHTIYSLP